MGNKPGEVMMPLSAPEQAISTTRKFTAIAIAAGVLIGACSSNEDSADTTARSNETTTSTSVSSDVEPQDVSDADLAAANFMCGGEREQTSMEDFSYKYDFFTASEQNEQLAESVFDITVNDPKWGMGEEAFDLALSNMYVNSTTQENKPEDATTGNSEFDQLLDGIFAYTLENDRVYINGDCRNELGSVTMPSPDLPVINLLNGSSVEGVIVPEDIFAQMRETMPKDTNGNIFFDFIELTVRTVDEDGKEVLTPVVLLVLFANGCDNTIRVEPPEETPSTTTTRPGDTTSTSSSLPGKGNPAETLAPPATTNPGQRPVTTSTPFPATTTPDTLPDNVTPTTWDVVPTPSTIQDPDGPPVTAVPPTTAAPAATTPSAPPASGTVVSR